jgi:hypothetical protein
MLLPLPWGVLLCCCCRCCCCCLLVLLLLLLQVPVPGAIASLQMSPQGVVHSFYPLEGNQAAMHHNLLKGDSNRR